MHPQPLTYHGRYLDPNFDSFSGNYINLYNEYAVGQTQPVQLRNAVYRDGNNGKPLHVLVHVRVAPAPGAPADPGMIVAFHRLTRHDTPFGQVQMSFDNMGLGFFGDIIDGQAPTTVVIPDNLYTQLPQTQVPDAGLLAQLFAADPAAEVFGPYAAGDPDVTAITTRQLVIVPNCYAAPFLTTGMTPKAAYLVLSGLIARDNQEIACAPLLDWVRTALTRRGGAAGGPHPVTCCVPLVPPAFMNPRDQQAFAAYRLEVLHTDFPHLRPGTHHNSAILIAQGITALTSEQRLARQEAHQHRQDREAPKTVYSQFRTRLTRLMQVCQVDNEDDLPPIYLTLANTKKGQIRVALQAAIEDTLSDLQLSEDFPVSTTLATKIVELKWHSGIPDDFTIGINIFNLGSLEEEGIENQRRLNHHADAISGGDTAPSLMDIATIQDAKHDVCIPRTLAQLRYSVERSQALWQVLLGSHHPVTQQHKRYRDYLVNNEKSLERINPRDQAMRYIVPALLARVVQLDVNAWLKEQFSSPQPVPFTSLTAVFKDIARQTAWEPVFPVAYLHGPPPPALYASAYPHSISAPSSTAPTIDASTLSGSNNHVPGASAASIAPSSTTSSTTLGTAMQRNTNHNQDVFGKFKALGLKARALKDALKQNGIETPLSGHNHRMCITYHVQGLCNERCKLAKDHRPHTAAEDEALRAWCETHYKKIE